jgi:transcriptional regulator with XRE-family HTH domain
MPIAADELLRRKIAALMRQRGWSQVELRDCLERHGYKRSQAWVSRKLTGVQAIKTRDLDLFATVFRVTLPELFFDEYGQWYRRSGRDRRQSERRQEQRTIFDPKVELTPEVGRLAFPKDPKA